MRQWRDFGDNSCFDWLPGPAMSAVLPSKKRTRSVSYLGGGEEGGTVPPPGRLATIDKPKLKSRRRAPLRPFWERGYRSHGYWLGKQRIGIVEVEPGKNLELRYHWRVGNHVGQAPTLKDAKRRVEEAVLMGGRQLLLFQE